MEEKLQVESAMRQMAEKNELLSKLKDVQANLTKELQSADELLMKTTVSIHACIVPTQYEKSYLEPIDLGRKAKYRGCG